MKQFVMAIDQGTTSARAILFDQAGQIVGEMLRGMPGIKKHSVPSHDQPRNGCIPFFPTHHKRFANLRYFSQILNTFQDNINNEVNPRSKAWRILLRRINKPLFFQLILF